MDSHVKVRDNLLFENFEAHKIDQLYRDGLVTIGQKNAIYKRMIRKGWLWQYGHGMLTVFDKNGRKKGFGEGYNLVVDAGKGELADLMIAVVTNTINAMNIGTSSTAALSTDTDLIAPAAPTARQAIASGGRFRSNLLITFSVLVASGTFTRPVTVREVGVFFDPLATGKLFARAVITAVTLASGDSGRLDYEIQL